MLRTLRPYGISHATYRLEKGFGYALPNHAAPVLELTEVDNGGTKMCEWM